MIERTRAALLDLDGCLILADSPLVNHARPLAGAGQLLDWLRAAELPFLVFTNGSGLPPAGHVERMGAIGLRVQTDEFLTPAVVAAEYVSRTYGSGPVLAFGGAGVTEPLYAQDVELVGLDQHQRAAAVLIGWDTEFGVAKLDAACRAVWNGAELLVTSDSRWLASENGRHVGVAGAISAGIRHVTGVEAKVLGKPSELAMKAVLDRLRVAPADLLVVGDDPELEIRMGRQAGTMTALVLTGIADEADAAGLNGELRPDIVVRDVPELLTLMTSPTSADGSRA
jgi:4-nitrophenyl phosphatase